MIHMNSKHILSALLVAASAGAMAQDAPSGGYTAPMAPPPGAFAAPSGPGFANPADYYSNNNGPTVGTEVPSDAVFQYDPETDSLIVITDESTNAQIARVIETLDRPVPQVLIKVLFLEVTYSKGSDIGVQATLTSNAGPADNALETYASDFGLSTAAQGALVSVTEGDITAIMRALATTGKLEVLSRPSILARNNEEATITIGQEIPFVRNSRVTDNGEVINTVEYDDIGIILTVTPHITQNNMVEMEVSPEISTLTGDTVPISNTAFAAVIAKRSAQTRVAIQDGKTAVIGGLMQDNKTENVRKIPLLGDIPGIGFLFRRTIKSKTKTELLIFLTPYVINGSKELDNVTAREHSLTEIEPKAFKDVKKDKYFDDAPNPQEKSH
ncbi:hypothetical protein BH09SUM1_BH09SUM1_14920 [soil metagenome]